MMHFIKQMFDRLFGPKTYASCVASLTQMVKSLTALSEQHRAEEEWANAESDRLDDLAILAALGAKRAKSTASKIKELIA